MESVYDHHQQDGGGGSVVAAGGITNLYNKILEVHWKFLDAEESMEKINLRRQLEDLIVQYICNMPHSQKFMLLQTVQVLQSSIAKMEDFSAYKASIGFEAISQYANNLFTKPWRKEYKVIKMYSGFYQHEIAANLVGAEALFEQMGYKTLPNKTLVLDGPICPDRVTNVSRDAITATVECQIMKEICAQLTDMKLAVNWSDIYSFRELNTMNVEQTVLNMAMLIQEKHHKNQQARRKESYGNPLVPAVSSCNSCSSQYQFHPHMQQQPHQHQQPVPPPQPSMAMQPPLTIPFCGPQPLYNTTPCNIHSQPSYGYHHHFLPNSPSQPPPHPSSQSSGLPTHPPPPLGAIPHSKSLDHYQDPAAAMYNLAACMQRHSIDQPPFDYAAVSSASHYGGPMGMAPPSSGVYDAVDGSCGMTPYSNHPYNVSGNRFPLPYNLSANLSGPCMNGGGKQNGTESFYQPSINGYQQQHVMPPYYHHRSNSNGQLYGQQQQQQQQSHRHTAADIYMNHNFDSTGPPLPPSILSKKKSSYDDYDVPVPTRHHHPVEPKTHAGDLIYIDTRDEAGKRERKKSDRGVRNPDLMADYEIDMLPEALMERQQHQHQQQQQQQNQLRHPYLHHQTSRNSRQSDFDSYEDEQLQAGAYQRATNVSKRISSKNQEGIGSYESWNYVFQNLEKQGYNKDLGERGDVLVVNPEDEDYPEGANNSRGGTLKRSSNEKLKAMKPKAADKVDGIRTGRNAQQQSQRENERNENAAARAAGQKNALVQKLSKTSNSNNPDNSSQPKANHNHTSNPTSSSNSRRNSITRKISTTSTKDQNGGNSSSASGGGILVNHTHPTASGKKKTASFDTAAATIINPHDNGSSAEWNCEFCTFLNPESRRICEMCSKSRDFNGATTTTAAATTSTSNGTATCV